MAGPQWLSTAIAYVREHARFWRSPVHWQPTAATPKGTLPDTALTDRNGNQTLRARQQVKALEVLDDAGQACVILEIVPVDPVSGYERMHVVLGRAHYELKDGTPVKRVSTTLFEVSSTGARLTLPSP